MVALSKGTDELLRILVNEFPSSNNHTLCISHDSILAFFVNALTEAIVDQSNGFGYLDGVALTKTLDNKFHLHWSDRTIDIADKVQSITDAFADKSYGLFGNKFPSSVESEKSFSTSMVD